MTRLGGARRARHGSVALATLITVAFAYLAVRNVDFAELRDSLRGSNYWWLLPALATLLLGFFIRVLRWRSLFSEPARPALWPATQALLVGQFFNNVLPLRAGDAVRVVALGGRSRAETAATIVIERLFDVLALLLLLFVALPWLPDVTWVRAASILALALTVASAFAVLLLRVYGERSVRFVLRPLARLPFISPERLEAAVRNLTEGVIGLRSARLGVLAFLWTLLSWLVLAVSFWLVMLGFDLGLAPAAGLLAVIATSLSLILPSAPAAVGVFEAAGIVALAAYGVPQTPALSYALVVHALNVLPFVVAGLTILILQRGLVRPFTASKRGDEGLISNGSGLDARGAHAGARAGSGRPGYNQNDVAEPADRDLHVDEFREAR